MYIKFHGIILNSYRWYYYKLKMLIKSLNNQKKYMSDKARTELLILMFIIGQFRNEAKQNVNI